MSADWLTLNIVGEFDDTALMKVFAEGGGGFLCPWSWRKKSGNRWACICWEPFPGPRKIFMPSRSSGKSAIPVSQCSQRSLDDNFTAMPTLPRFRQLIRKPILLTTVFCNALQSLDADLIFLRNSQCLARQEYFAAFSPSSVDVRRKHPVQLPTAVLTRRK